MVKYGVKAVVPILAAALVLGLAASGFSQGKWVFGVKGNIAWVQPLKEGGDATMDYNDWIDDWNQDVEDWRDMVIALGGEAEVDLLEKIDRAYSMHAYAEGRIGDRFALRITGELLRTNISKGSWDFDYEDWYWWDGFRWWDGWTYTGEYETSASAWKIAIAPRYIMSVGNNWEVNVGAGPFYVNTKRVGSWQRQMTGVVEGQLFSYTNKLELIGSGFGFSGDLELTFKLSDRMGINVEVGYESTPKLTTSGQLTTTGEDWWGTIIDEEMDMEGALDWTGFYVAFSLEFTI